jgi:hypothetical protein
MIKNILKPWKKFYRISIVQSNEQGELERTAGRIRNCG